MFHIIISTPKGEEYRGKASNRDEFIKLLTVEEIKSIFENDAYNAVDDVFNEAKKKAFKDTYIASINNISISVVSNGYEITTLVFYL